VNQSSIVINTSVLRRVLVLAVGLLVLVIVVLVVRRSGVLAFLDPGALDAVDKNGYQAVFLTGGQVYFGKLQQQGSYFLLTDVFYLSVPSDPNAQPQLVKRGSEIQAPVDPMIIPAGQILYIENLRPDGQVATAIRKFKAGEIPSATAPPVTGAPTSRPSASPAR
jgi:hypothetical protein